MSTGPDVRAGTDRDDADRPRVVVGVDGSPGARAALRSALLEATRRGASLEVVAAYPEALVWTGGLPLEVPDVDAVRQDTRDRALTFLDEVRTELLAEGADGVAELPVQLVVAGGPPAVVLGHQAEGAALLVVGSRGRGALSSVLLGSVALHCVAHAPCPVSVVHRAPEARDTRQGKVPGKVIAGFDGSDASVGALREALAEAVRLGTDVDVVVAHSLADHWADMHAAVPDVEELRTRARDRARAVADQLLAERAAAGEALPRVQVVLVEGSPTAALLEAAEDAALLVVGSRGHGMLRGLLLGSVALHCVVHAPCPVIVVHRQDAAAPAPPADQPAMARG